VTALLIWLGAVLTGYVRKPSTTVLAALVALGGGCAIASFVIAAVVANRSPRQLENERARARVGYSFAALATGILVAMVVYLVKACGHNPYWGLVLGAFTPVVGAFVLAELVRGFPKESLTLASRFLKKGSTRDRDRLHQLRRCIRGIGIAWMMLGAAAWLVISPLRGGAGSPLFAIELELLGLLYWLGFHQLESPASPEAPVSPEAPASPARRLRALLSWVVAVVAASVLVLLVAQIVTRGICEALVSA
jgi:MFS family permease